MEFGMDVLRDSLSQIIPLADEHLAAAKRRLDNLTKPVGSLGKLEAIAAQYAAIKQRMRVPLWRTARTKFSAYR